MFDFLMSGTPPEDLDDAIIVRLVVEEATYDAETGEELTPATYLDGDFYLVNDGDALAVIEHLCLAIIERETGAVSSVTDERIIGCYLSANFAGSPYVPLFHGVPVQPPAPTSSDVDRERDRRIAAGFRFNGVLYQSRQTDRENMAGASTTALAAIINGSEPGNLRWADPDNDFDWIAADNTLQPMDAHTVFEFGRAAMTHKQAHIFAARTIKDMVPIPDDYAMNNEYWPA